MRRTDSETVGTAMAKWRHYVDGQEMEPAQAVFLQSYNPTTGQPVADIPDGGAEDVARAVEAAAAAAPAWRAMRPLERGRILTAVAHKVPDPSPPLSQPQPKAPPK